MVFLVSSHCKPDLWEENQFHSRNLFDKVPVNFLLSSVSKKSSSILSRLSQITMAWQLSLDFHADLKLVAFTPRAIMAFLLVESCVF